MQISPETLKNLNYLQGMLAMKRSAKELLDQGQYEQAAQAVRKCPKLLPWFLEKSMDVVDELVSNENHCLALDFVNRVSGEMPPVEREILATKLLDSIRESP
ncbi:MAG: hypothetical protein PHO90_00565 [Candidatus Pacebacteria bacterium]|nr:hypothetical protein [Candidatus Paceibacterota bacterium]